MSTENLPPAAESTEVMRMRQQLAQMENELTEARQPPAQPAPAQTKDAWEKQFWKNPGEKVVEVAGALVNQAMGQVQAATLGPLEQIARDNVRKNDPELFDKYVGEIEGRMQAVAPLQRTQPAVWQSAFDMVKGAHLTDIISSRQSRQAPSAPDGPAAPSSVPQPAPVQTELSAEEATMAKRLGLTPESYRRGKENYATQSDLGPSSWDSVITTDSAAKRRRTA